jgi:hypothetical protein
MLRKPISHSFGVLIFFARFIYPLYRLNHAYRVASNLGRPMAVLLLDSNPPYHSGNANTSSFITLSHGPTMYRANS